MCIAGRTVRAETHGAHRNAAPDNAKASIASVSALKEWRRWASTSFAPACVSGTG